MRLDNEELAELEWERFKKSLVAAHPFEAKKLLEIMEAPQSSLARELSDEEMEGYQPITGEEASATIRALREFGLAID